MPAHSFLRRASKACGASVPTHSFRSAPWVRHTRGPLAPPPAKTERHAASRKGASRETPPPPLRAGATGLPRRCTDLWRMSSPIWSILPLTLLAERPASGPGHPATCRSLRSCRGSRRRDARRTVQPAVGGEGEEANRCSNYRARPPSQRPRRVRSCRRDETRWVAATRSRRTLLGCTDFAVLARTGGQAVLGRRFLRGIAV